MNYGGLSHRLLVLVRLIFIVVSSPVWQTVHRIGPLVPAHVLPTVPHFATTKASG